MTWLPAAVLLTAWLTAPQSAAADQDALARAKELYATAAYDEALAALDTMPQDAGDGASLEAAEYRVFCLLALERQEDAKTAIKAIVSAHPLFQLPEDKASPRIQAVFREIRRQMFPDLVQRAYTDAKAAFDRHDAAAAAKFDTVTALLDDPDAQGVPALADLRTVAAGFRDLSKAAAAAAAAPPAAAPSSPPPAAPSSQASAPDRPETADPLQDPRRTDSAVGTAGPTTPGPNAPAPTASAVAVIPPVAIYQPIPPWVAATPKDQQQEFKGTLELLIDRSGHVASVKLRKSINPRYDAELMKAARTWRFRPATKDGDPTPFVKVVDIQLIPR